MTMTTETIVAICQYGGEFATKDDGTTSYTGGEAHAVTISRNMPFDDLKSEVSNMFSIDTSTMSIKYFLPFNRRTLITISNDKDFERMIDFHANSLSVDIFVSNKIDNRSTRSVVADSGTSMIDTVGADCNLRSRRSTAAKNKRVSIVDSSMPKVVTNAVAENIKRSSLPRVVTSADAENIKRRKQKATESVAIRVVAEDSVLPVVSTPTIDINRQEMLEYEAFGKVDINSEFMHIIDGSIPHAVSSVDNDNYMIPFDSTGQWDNVITDVGQEFENVRTFRDELCKYAFAKGFRYKFIKNEHTRVTAKCISDGCPWRIHASRTSRNQAFMIKKLNNVHTCGQLNGEDGQPRAKRYWLASIIRGKVLDNPDVRPKDIARDLYNNYGISFSYCQAWHAKENARKEVHMLQEEACNQLPWLCEQVTSTNPGSVTMLTTSQDAKIRRCFVSLYASLHGFEHGCRPLLFLDRICLRINNQWKLLVAVSVDGNNDIFPIAFACVEDETPDSWHWFLAQLKYAVPEYHKLTIVSTRQKGLDDSVPEVFVDSHHCYSLYHLTQELKAELKRSSLSDQEKDTIIDAFKAAARAYLLEDFNAYMDKINNISEDVAKWIMSLKPEHWSNALSMGTRYDNLSSSDIVEPLSNWISMKDELSSVQILHSLLVKTADAIQKREEASRTLEGMLTQSSEKKLQKEIPKARTLNVICSTETMFEVRCSTVNVVNIGNWECTCRRWQITGLPCMHAIAVCNRLDRSVYGYCSRYFRKESYVLTYSEPVPRLPDIDEMKVFFPASSYPPPTNRPPGRPKRKRINPYKTSIRPLRCSRCKVVGHNKATCEAQL